MSVTERPGPAQGPGRHDVDDLLQRCGRTRDRAERAALLARVARELDGAADEIAVDGEGAEQGRDAGDAREVMAALRGQASMARFVADLERQDRAHRAATSQPRA